MFNLFRETYTSLQNNQYGNVIIEKTLRQVIFYWTKYLLLIGAIMILFAVFFMTNRLPQLPKFIQSVIPDARYELRDGVFSSTLTQPYVQGDTNFSFIIDTAATSSAMSPYSSGVLITGNDIIIKSEDGTIASQSFKNFPSFSTSSTELATAVSANFVKIWLILTAGIIVVTLFIGSLLWLQKFLSFAIWSLIFFFITKYFLKKSLSYLNTLKIVIYASVLPFLFSIIISSSPNPIFDVLGLGIMAYFAFNWIGNLDFQLPRSSDNSGKPLKKASSGKSRKQVA